MATHPLGPDNRVLVEAARRVIALRHREGWRVVGAALRTRSGRVFTGVHLEATVGRIAVCAEAVALGHAATEAGDTDIAAIVAVYHPGGGTAGPDLPIVAPCGMCREMIADYAPTARVILDEALAVDVADLLPDRYRRPPPAG